MSVETMSGAKPSLLRRMNQRRVLQVLQQNGPISRAELTRFTGISPPTVSKTVAGLIGAQLLEEGPQQSSTGGRPASLVQLAGKSVQILGVELAPQTCRITSTGLDGQLGAAVEFDCPDDYDQLVATTASNARQIAAQSPGVQVLGIGVSIPGLLDEQRGKTLMSPNLHPLDGRSFGVDLSKRLDWRVALVQEATGLCMAERIWGDARGIDQFAMVDLRRGLGLGVVADGQQLEGRSGLAGELGHITVNTTSSAKLCGCGNTGCLETEATDHALLTSIKLRTGRSWTFEELIDGAGAGNVDIIEPLETVLDYLAIGLAAVVNIFNPHKLFMHGLLLQIPGAFDQLVEKTARRAMAPTMNDCEFALARANKLQGALAAIIDQLIASVEELVE